jgi:hypothetical protein
MPNRLSPFEYVQYAMNTPLAAGQREADLKMAESGPKGSLPAMDISPQGPTMSAPPVQGQTFYNFLRHQDQGQMPPGLEPVLFDDSVLFQQAEPNVYEKYENVPLDISGANVMTQEPTTPEQQQIIRELVRQWNQGLGGAPAFPEKRSAAPRNMGADWRFGEG